VGQDVEVSPAEHPDLVSKGKISRVAGALDIRTRTMLAEADLDNRDGKFMSGGYVRVALRLPKGNGRIEIPSEALLMKGDKPFAATLDGGQVHLQPLVLGDDVGSRVRVLQGLAAGTRIILNPSPSLQDGDKVQALD
jgi:multidrug efflux pump subunit AcrA (membrane-fusion protein)